MKLGRLAVVILVLAAGCLAALSSSQNKSLTIPETEKNRKNPLPNVPEAIGAGRSLYAVQCAMCHGERADGRGGMATELKLVIPDLTLPDRQARRTDGEWFYIIGQGHVDMPAERLLVAQQKWELILYLRSLRKPPAAK